MASLVLRRNKQVWKQIFIAVPFFSQTNFDKYLFSVTIPLTTQTGGVIGKDLETNQDNFSKTNTNSSFPWCLPSKKNNLINWNNVFKIHQRGEMSLGIGQRKGGNKRSSDYRPQLHKGRINLSNPTLVLKFLIPKLEETFPINFRNELELLSRQMNCSENMLKA